MDIDTQKIEQLLAEKKYDEVREIIRAAVSQEFTEEERGAALVGFANAYLKVSNAINEKYLEALKEAVEAYDELDKAEGSISDKVELSGLRSELGL